MTIAWFRPCRTITVDSIDRRAAEHHSGHARRGRQVARATRLARILWWACATLAIARWPRCCSPWATRVVAHLTLRTTAASPFGATSAQGRMVTKTAGVLFVLGLLLAFGLIERAVAQQQLSPPGQGQVQIVPQTPGYQVPKPYQVTPQTPQPTTEGKRSLKSCPLRLNKMIHESPCGLGPGSRRTSPLFSCLAPHPRYGTHCGRA